MIKREGEKSPEKNTWVLRLASLGSPMVSKDIDRYTTNSAKHTGFSLLISDQFGTSTDALSLVLPDSPPIPNRIITPVLCLLCRRLCNECSSDVQIFQGIPRGSMRSQSQNKQDRCALGSGQASTSNGSMNDSLACETAMIRMQRIRMVRILWSHIMQGVSTE